MAYTVVTLADLKASMAQRWDGSVFWTAEEARLAINEALREWNFLTGRWRRHVTADTAAGQVEYALPSSLTYGLRVRIGATPLVPTSTYELDYGRPSWRGETAASGGSVPTVPTHWAPQSLTRIVIWPATATSVINALHVDGVAATPTLVEDGDFVDLGQELQDTLLDYAVHVTAFKEGGPRWALTLPYATAFLRAAAEENGQLKANQRFRRYAGLDRRRDLQPTHKAPTQLDQIVQAVGSSQADSGAG